MEKIDLNKKFCQEVERSKYYEQIKKPHFSSIEEADLERKAFSVYYNV